MAYGMGKGVTRVRERAVKICLTLVVLVALAALGIPK